MRTKVTVGVLIAALASTAFVGAAAQEGPDRVDRLTVAYNAFENNITPFTLTMQSLPNAPDLVHLVHDALFWSQASDEPRPMLALDATPNGDFTSWTVELRDGVTWHDGEPFTADDVAFSYRYYAEVGRLNRFAHHVWDVPPFEDAEVLDDLTVRLDFAAPAPTFPLLPGGDTPIVPAHIWEDIDDPGAETERLPVGTGPFELVEIEPDQLYRFEANEDYFLGRPLVDELVLPIVPDPSAAFAGLRTGELDAAVHPIPPELVDQIEEDDALAVLESTRMESVIIFFNAADGLTGDPTFRRALASAIDRDEIVEVVMQGNAQPGLDTFTHPESVWATDDPVQEFDRDRANQLLDDAGYAVGDDGVRVSPDGERASFEVLVSSFAPQHQRALELVSEHAAEVGIEVGVESLDPATLADRRRPEEGADRPGVPAYVRAMESHMHADPDAMIHFFGMPQPGRPGGAFTGYSEPAFDEVAERVAVETDPDARLELIHELQAMFARDVPAIVLYYPDGLYAVNPASFDGWVADRGHGTFHKLSFVPDGAELATGELQLATAPADGDTDDADGTAETATDALATDDGSIPWAIVLAVLAALAIVVTVLARRRREEAYD